jgi:hypothetical protein
VREMEIYTRKMVVNVIVLGNVILLVQLEQNVIVLVVLNVILLVPPELNSRLINTFTKVLVLHQK